MEDKSYSRRNFLRTAAMGATVAAAGKLFTVSGKPAVLSEAKAAPATATMSMYVCSICGHIEFGSAPDNCPVCHAPKDKFTLNDAVFSDAMKKFPDKAESHAPVISIKKESSLVPDMPGKEVRVRVGKIMHPMEQAHHIKFIDFYIDDKYVDRFPISMQLYPAVSFYVKAAGGSKIRMIELCNLHGYWQTEVEMG
jgi:superoxide reductase